MWMFPVIEKVALRGFHYLLESPFEPESTTPLDLL